jgi:hypothetical protein
LLISAAIELGDLEMIKLFASEDMVGIFADVCDVAAGHCNVECVKYLREDFCGDMSSVAYDRAAVKGNIPVAEYAHSIGIVPSDKCIAIAIEHGQTEYANYIAKILQRDDNEVLI